MATRMKLTATLKQSAVFAVSLIAVLLMPREPQPFAASTPGANWFKIGYASVTGNRISLWAAEIRDSSRATGSNPTLFLSPAPPPEFQR